MKLKGIGEWNWNISVMGIKSQFKWEAFPPVKNKKNIIIKFLYLDLRSPDNFLSDCMIISHSLAKELRKKFSRLNFLLIHPCFIVPFPIIFSIILYFFLCKQIIFTCWDGVDRAWINLATILRTLLSSSFMYCASVPTRIIRPVCNQCYKG